MPTEKNIFQRQIQDMDSKKDLEADSSTEIIPVKSKRKSSEIGATVVVNSVKKDMWRPDEDLRLMQIIDMHSARNWN